MNQKPAEFDKYHYYEKSVQNFKNEVEFIHKTFKQLRNREPYTLREDFGGTGGISCEWTRLSPEHHSWAIDLDQEPVDYGTKHHYSALTSDQQKRMKYVLGNVLEKHVDNVDVAFAFNFSYMIFHKRETLLEYFKTARSQLNTDGAFFMDIFGGPDSQTIIEEKTKHEGYNYYWDCQEFNPVTHECTFAIHFKVKGEKKRKNCFVYRWRLWTIPEIKDLLLEAGFKDVKVYWELDDEDGDGSGEFEVLESPENCPAWVAYIAALN